MKVKVLFQIVVSILVLTACSKEDGIVPSNAQDAPPVVKVDATYEVLFEEDIIYAEGLSHQTRNSSSYSKLPLKLDIYTPNNKLENRPAFVFIHGGGFFGGSKQQSQILNFANYYTSRGWVFISVDYRVKNDMGTVQQEWVSYYSSIPPNNIPQFLAIYPAQRDAKAAMRWTVAHAEAYNINTDYITVGGGSAGAITAITLGISNQEDYRDEISLTQDPTLSTTNLEQTYQVQTIINFWGSKVALDILEGIYGHQRFDRNDPPMFIAHGTEDPTVPFSSAEDLKAIYEANGIPLAYYPFEGYGHGAWNATVNNKRLEELTFDFIVEQQNLVLE